ncbi:uncharacterized protein [Dysidea avara]|uniref:uncharacterized protein n=1 Tax=Dysidea avara TaxID=196820 RepID=UPI003323B3AD
MTDMSYIKHRSLVIPFRSIPFLIPVPVPVIITCPLVRERSKTFLLLVVGTRMFRFLAKTSRATRSIRFPWNSLGVEVAGGNSTNIGAHRAAVGRAKSTDSTSQRAIPESLAMYGENDYFKSLRCANEQLHEALASPTRFQSIYDREDRTDTSSPESTALRESYGKYITQYRGSFMMKNAYDLAIYSQLFNHVQPRTVIEIGSFTGASAMWFSDTAKLLGYDCIVYSIDIEHGLIDETIKTTKPQTVKFIQGDATKLKEVLYPSMLKPLPHPWLVVEDCHHSIATALTYLNQFMNTGDYLVIEDTSPYTLKTEQSGTNYIDKLNIVKEFLKGPVGRQYKVDSFFTDFYGYNCTWHWHGFLRKFDE